MQEPVPPWTAAVNRSREHVVKPIQVNWLLGDQGEMRDVQPVQLENLMLVSGTIAFGFVPALLDTLKYGRPYVNFIFSFFLAAAVLFISTVGQGSVSMDNFAVLLLFGLPVLLISYLLSRLVLWVLKLIFVRGTS